jgi:hypothetical protein
MTYKNGYKLKRKKDGTYYVPKRRAEDGTEYVPAEYKNVDKKCTCKRPGYCTNFLDSRHGVHICIKCGGIMAICRSDF